MIVKGSYVEIIDLLDDDVEAGIEIGDIFQVIDDNRNFPICKAIVSDCSERTYIMSMSQISEIDYCE